MIEGFIIKEKRNMNTETFYVDIELHNKEAFDLSGLAVLSQEYFGDRQVIRIGYSMLSFLDGSYEIYRFVSRYREQVLCVESYRHDITALTRTFPSFFSGMVGLWRERLDYFYGYCGRLLIRADENFDEVCRKPLGHFLRRELPVETSLEAYKKALSRSSDYRALVAAATEAGYAVQLEGRREAEPSGRELYMAVLTVRDSDGAIVPAEKPFGRFPELAARECFLVYNTRMQRIRERRPGCGMMRAVRRMRRSLPKC